MRLLLDTHVMVGVHTSDPPRQDTKAHALLASMEHDLFVSMASLWELTIKHALPGRRGSAMPIAPRDFLQLTGEAGVEMLPIAPEHIFALEGLPALHGDPFDRLLVAQAIAEGMRLVTRDRLLAGYSDCVLVI